MARPVRRHHAYLRPVQAHRYLRSHFRRAVEHQRVVVGNKVSRRPAVRADPRDRYRRGGRIQGEGDGAHRRNVARHVGLPNEHRVDAFHRRIAGRPVCTVRRVFHQGAWLSAAHRQGADVGDFVRSGYAAVRRQRHRRRRRCRIDGQRKSIARGAFFSTTVFQRVGDLVRPFRQRIIRRQRPLRRIVGGGHHLAVHVQSGRVRQASTDVDSGAGIVRRRRRAGLALNAAHVIRIACGRCRLRRWGIGRTAAARIGQRASATPVTAEATIAVTAPRRIRTAGAGIVRR